MNKYLIAVLDWGLGHASRCIPLARQLLSKGHQVYFASSGNALALLKKECPQVPVFELVPYNIQYRYSSMPLNALLHLMPVLNTIFRERQQVNTIVSSANIDCIISDGRFGCYHADTKNIWLAHQLHIQYDFQLLKNLLNRSYHQYIKKRFSEVWVPDFKGINTLAGDLSKPISGLEHQYLGPLSRYSSPAQKSIFQYKWFALLSGPEPQRSILEKELSIKLAGCSGLIVRGVPGDTAIQSIDKNLKIVDWLHGENLAQTIAESQYLICRSGYSTLMDLYYWKKKALLIPTPGQTEQEYLGTLQMNQGKAIVQKQGKIAPDEAEKKLSNL